jgi:hypothetical protein
LVVSWATEERWTLDAFLDYFSFNRVRNYSWERAWDEGKLSFRIVSFFLLAIALFLAAIRMPMVARIISDFLLARGPIYSLASTITQVSQVVKELAPTIKLLSDKSDALQVQLAELQRYTSSERTEPGDGTDEPPAGSPGAATPSRPAVEDTRNWESLRALWYANTARIEAVINGISDGRKKLKYDRMPRTNYNRIINALANDGFISDAAKKASIELNKTFARFRPRNQKIPDSAIGALEVLDKQLELAIGKPSPDDEDTEPEPPAAG